MVETETKEWHAEAERMKNKKFCIKIRAWVWEYSDENFEKSKLQKEIKKLLTSLDEYAILNKLSHETATTKMNIDNWTIDNKPWKFLQEIFQERTSKDVEPEQ